MNHVASIDTPKPFLTKQEESFCVAMSKGLDAISAGKEVGLKKAAAIKMLERAEIKEYLAILKYQIDQYRGVDVTVELLNSMLFEAHATAATSTEKISAVRELGKMNGLYAPEKRELDVKVVTKVEQLEGMSDEELLRRAQLSEKKLKNDPIEGEFKEV